MLGLSSKDQDNNLAWTIGTVIGWKESTKIMRPKTSDSLLILPGIESTNLPQVESHSSISRCTCGGCFPPVSRFFANNFGSNKGTHSKLSDFS